MLESERISVGITTGAALSVGALLATQHPDKVVVVVSPDGGERYVELIGQASLRVPVGGDLVLQVNRQEEI